MNKELFRQLAALEDTLRERGLQSALEELNARVPHRFTGIYYLDGGMTLRNIVLVDKQGEVAPDNLLEVPLQDSFCQFVLKDGPLLTKDSAVDEKVPVGHPFKGVVSAYVGLPLVKYKPTLYGTLCHFDFDTQDVEPGEFEYLKQVAQALSPYLPQ